MALTIADPASAGLATPETFAADIHRRINTFAVCRNHATFEPMPGNKHKVGLIATNPVASVTGEGDMVPLSDPVFGQVVLTPSKITASGVATRELMEDSGDSTPPSESSNRWDQIVAAYADAVMFKEDEQCFVGDGVGENQLGIVNALQANSLISSTAAGVVSMADLAAMLEALPMIATATAPRFFMHRTVYALLGQTAVTANASPWPIVQTISGDRGNLLGYEVVFVPSMADSTVTTAGTVPVLFGHMERAVIFGERTKLFTRVLFEELAMKDSVRIMARERIAVSLWDDGADKPGALLGLQLSE